MNQPSSSFDGDSFSMADRVAALCNRPLATLATALLLIALFAAGLTKVSKDPSVDAFVPDTHPAAVARDRAEKIFGLEDPVIVAISTTDNSSVFTPEGLEILVALHREIRLVEGVKKNDVVSISTENSILGDEGSLLVDPIIPDGPITQEIATQAWQRVQAMPMMLGLLTSRAGDLVTLIVPVEDPDHAEQSYNDILEIAQSHRTDKYQVQVAGVAAMNAELGAAVNNDTRVFVPLAVVVVFMVLLVALRRPKALLGPLLVVAGSAAVGIGTLGWMGSRYYLITTALPVIIMAIAVADSLHLIAFYDKARQCSPTCTAKEAVRQALLRTLLPITLTSITTAAGFIGLSYGAAMRPISEFGLYATVGVLCAWVLSITALPAILVLTDLKARAPARKADTAPLAERIVTALSHASLRAPARALLIVGCTFVVLAILASQARFDYQRSNYFPHDEPVRIADATLNERLGGINFLDVMISARVEDGLLTPQAIRAIAELTDTLEEMPLVTHVVGIDDYISLMHVALRDDAAPGSLPENDRAPAQYMLLYEASGAPEDFKQEIDYTGQHALVRAQLSTDSFVETRQTVERLRSYLAQWSVQHDLQGEVSGRVAVNDGWMSLLQQNHFVGLALAVALVFLATFLSFRSAGYALLAMMPVAFGILFVYAAMGALGVSIAPATSMTAAIATGLGVDFGVHLIAHVRKRLVAGETLSQAVSGDYAMVGRACIHAAMALTIALAAICLSSVPVLRWFASLVAAGCIGSLFGALVILPAVLAFTHSRRTAGSFA